jgi:hypothetical protein
MAGGPHRSPQKVKFSLISVSVQPTIQRMGQSWHRISRSQDKGPLQKSRPLEGFDQAVIAMEVGDCIEADAVVSTIRVRLWKLKKRQAWTRRFKIQQWTPYFSRIWRLE